MLGIQVQPGDVSWVSAGGKERSISANFSSGTEPNLDLYTDLVRAKVWTLLQISRFLYFFTLGTMFQIKSS